MSETSRKPGLLMALLPVFILMILLTINVYVYGDDSSYGPNQMALVVGGIVAALIGVFHLKMSYSVIEKKAMDSVGVSLQAVMILLVVGSLIGVWILNGVVPAMIYYGIKLINPAVFLPVSLLICSVVSLATGSSWSTVGTVGIALMGIGHTLGIPEGMVGGAIVSGAYFGDKMSPLSDTTNLAPAMAGSSLFEHIRHMTYTSGPSIIITFIIFSILGFFYSGESISTNEIETILSLLETNFNITAWLFLLPALVFFLVKKKLPALPALAIGTIVGSLFVLIFQQDLLIKLSGGEFSFLDSYKVILKTSYAGFVSDTGDKVVDKLLSRGGMSSMLNTVWLILTAMIFGGLMEVTGLLKVIAESILKGVRGVTSLVAATVGTSFLLNLTTSDQFIAIVVTGRMFKQSYKDHNLAPKNLSRAVEDGATVTSVLIPWNTCGAYFSGVLGIATMTYAPFAFFNILSPFISVLVAASGKSMERLEENNDSSTL